MARYYLKLQHDLLLHYPLKFIIHYASYHLLLLSKLMNNNIVK
jgi:hypothetical protein